MHAVRQRHAREVQKSGASPFCSHCSPTDAQNLRNRPVDTLSRAGCCVQLVTLGHAGPGRREWCRCAHESGACAGSTRKTLAINLDSAEVHGVFDNLKIVGNAQFDGVDWLVEDPSVLVVLQGLQTGTRS